MKTKSPSIERIGLTAGIFTTLGLIAYFMFMKAIGLSQILELRFFNAIILATGIYFGIKNYKSKLTAKEFYLKGIAEGMFISAVSVSLFAIFMGIYLAYFDVALLEHIRSNMYFGNRIDPLTVVFTLFLEGMASGAIITFASFPALA